MKHFIPAAMAAFTLSFALVGCMVHVDKDQNGNEKKVEVDSPFGHVHVNTDQTTPADLGLPAYPGAAQVNDDGDNKSADVNVGFGQWEIKVKAISYVTPDSRDKVVDFYKKALGHFGTVISCQNSVPVGKPTITSEGLTCEQGDGTSHGIKITTDKNSKGISINSGNQGHDFELKAGSKHHQHIVGFENSTDGKTHFSLISVDLPADLDSGKKNN